MTSSPVRKMRLDVLRAAFAVAVSPDTKLGEHYSYVAIPTVVFDRLVAAVDAWRRLGAHPVPPPKQE